VYDFGFVHIDIVRIKGVVSQPIERERHFTSVAHIDYKNVYAHYAQWVHLDKYFPRA